MAKSAEDLVHLVSAIMESDHSKSFVQDWVGQKIGFVDDTLWKLADSICYADPVFIQQQRADYRSTKLILLKLGATITEWFH